MTTAPSYDAVPYRTRPRRPTHPETLATLALLKGLQTTTLERARILEIGCGTGGNVLASAHVLPEATFLGIDPSPVQIRIANTEAAALGLSNTTFEPIGIEDLPNDVEPFDFIICHGVHSWVPPVIRHAILATCRRVLAPQGVAMISFNVLPGWHLRRVARDAMLAVASGADDATVQIRRGRGYLQFLAANTVDRDSTWSRVLNDEQELLAKSDDFYIYHEHLETHHHPLYFRDFMAEAGANGLAYLGDSGYHPVLAGLSAETVEILERISANRIDLEQHVDYLRGRAFRHAVLIRDDATPSDQALAGYLPRLLIRSMAEPVGAGDAPLDVAQTYKNLHAVEMTTASPVMNAVLRLLSQAFPGTMPFETLATQLSGLFSVQGRGDADEALARLPEAVGNLYHAGFASLHAWQPRLATVPSDRPHAWAVARRIAEEQSLVPNVLGMAVELPRAERYLLLLCDGTRTQAEIFSRLKGAVPGDVAAFPDLPAVHHALQRLASHALLVD